MAEYSPRMLRIWTPPACMTVPSSFVIVTMSAASRSSMPNGDPKARSPMMSKARALNQSEHGSGTGVRTEDLVGNSTSKRTEGIDHSVALHALSVLARGRLFGFDGEIVPFLEQDVDGRGDVRLELANRFWSERVRDNLSLPCVLSPVARVEETAHGRSTA